MRITYVNNGDYTFISFKQILPLSRPQSFFQQEEQPADFLLRFCGQIVHWMKDRQRVTNEIKRMG